MNTFEKISDDKFKNDVIEKNSLSRILGGAGENLTGTTQWANGTLTCDSINPESQNCQTGGYPKEDITVIGNGSCTK